MNAELHADPSLGHAKKGSAELSEVAQRRAKMQAETKAYHGKSSSHSFKRPKRKVINRYA